MLISRKVTEVSEISHVNLRAGWKELTKPINRSNSSLVQDVTILFVGSISTTQDMTKNKKANMKNDTYECVREEENIMSMLQ